MLFLSRSYEKITQEWIANTIWGRDIGEEKEDALRLPAVRL